MLTRTTTFGSLNVGEVFFDPRGGEEWIKECESRAAVAFPSDPIDEGTTDVFAADDVVEV